MVAKSILLASGLVAGTIARPHTLPNSRVDTRGKKEDLAAAHKEALGMAALAAAPPIIIKAFEFGGGDETEEAAYVKASQNTFNKEAGETSGAYSSSVPQKTSSDKTFDGGDANGSQEHKQSKGFKEQDKSEENYGQNSYGATSEYQQSKEPKEQPTSDYTINYGQTSYGATSKEDQSNDQHKYVSSEDYGQNSYDATSTEGMSQEQEESKEQHVSESEVNYGQNSYGATAEVDQPKKNQELPQGHSLEEHKQMDHENAKDADDCEENVVEPEEEEQHKQEEYDPQSVEEHHDQQQSEEKHVEELQEAGEKEESPSVGDFFQGNSTASTEDKGAKTGEDKANTSYVQVAASSTVSAKTGLALLVGLVSALVLLG